MGRIDEYLEEEARRDRDLRINVIMSDGKWMFPVRKREPVVEINITKQIKQIENLIINKQGRIVGKVDEQIRKFGFASKSIG